VQGKRTYFRDLGKHFERDAIAKASLTVLVDPGNGVGALTTPYFLRELGCGVRTINSNVDGTFPNRPSEPTPHSLRYLTEIVRDQDIDFAVALDGDADRAIFLDENGQIHWGDKSFALIEKFFLMENNIFVNSYKPAKRYDLTEGRVMIEKQFRCPKSPHH
jgi:phosphomannomutase/phosphoglucomutase